MVKLTIDLIANASQYINPIKDRELNLRGYKIPFLENLGSTLDQFDTIDFSDNDIRKLDNFPLLSRLKCLILNNNRIMLIGENLGCVLPRLNSIILTNNSISELSEVEVLSSLKTLTSISLLHNPVVTKPHYRLFVIHKFPNLRSLDFRKVKQKERQEAASLFESKSGLEHLKEISVKQKAAVKTFEPGVPLVPKPTPGTIRGLTPVQVRNIKIAIAKATTLHEIERLNQMLRTGVIPGETVNGQNGDNEEEMEHE